MALYAKTYRVWWDETDAAGIAHFTSFFKYCERLEEEFLADLGFRNPPSGPVDAKIIFPRVKASCEYKYPLWPGDTYTVSIEDILVGEKSITYTFRIVNNTRGDKLSAQCTIVVVAYDTEKGKSIAIPEELRRELVRKGARSRDPSPDKRLSESV